MFMKYIQYFILWPYNLVFLFAILKNLVKKSHMHLNCKKQTIVELCLNCHEVLQKLYLFILEVKNRHFSLISRVSNKQIYNVFACMESY